MSQEQLNRLVALYNQGRLAEVIAWGEPLARQWSASAALHNILGAAYAGVGRHGEAEGAFRKAVSLNPGFSQGHNNLGNALQELGRTSEAEASYRRALELNPDNPDALYNLANTLRDRGEPASAIALYERLLASSPQDPDANKDMAIALQQAGRLEEAVAAYGRAITLRPTYSNAYFNLGNALVDLGRLDQALAAYERGLAIDPDDSLARAAKLHLQAKMGDWRWTGEFADRAETLGISGGAISPFAVLAMEDAPDRHARRSQVWAKAHFRPATDRGFGRPSVRPAKLRIGYFSADFFDHATLFLMAGVFRHHDRSRFEINVYSYGRVTHGERRRDLRSQVDGFFDVQGFSDEAVAALAREHKLDIAIDLKGYTQDSRSGIFAHGAAPMQMAYLGYPGAMGAPFIDYTIADTIVAPPEQAELYMEKLLYLPHSYQPNDNARMIAEAPSRQALGLPEHGFVFCCFNNNYKIGPAEFDIWMRLMEQLPGSVLWLLKSNRWAQENFRREAAARGIDPRRLVFADMAPQTVHLARQQRADLFLDTFNYNAHTTASDALWAGLPLVTKAGWGFPARVATSLLHAVGMPDLVTHSEAEYEALVLSLATDPARLAQIRARLAESRLTAPLFDSEGFTRDLEAGYQAAYDRYFGGLKPDIVFARRDAAGRAP